MDDKFEICEKCEFFNVYATCKVDNLNLYSKEGAERNTHCENFLLKGIYEDSSDIECALKEIQNNIK